MVQTLKEELDAKRLFYKEVLPARKRRIADLGLTNFVRINGSTWSNEGDEFLFRLNDEGFDEYLKELTSRKEEECEWCDGTGMVATDEDDGEGHTMRGVGTKKCICQYDI